MPQDAKGYNCTASTFANRPVCDTAAAPCINDLPPRRVQ
jgi:hypothetical protein